MTSNISYIAVEEGWLYLAACIDLHSWMIVGLSIQPYMRASLVTDALRMAWFRRRPLPALIVHNDPEMGLRCGQPQPEESWQAAVADFAEAAALQQLNQDVRRSQRGFHCGWVLRLAQASTRRL